MVVNLGRMQLYIDIICNMHTCLCTGVYKTKQQLNLLLYTSSCGGPRGVLWFYVFLRFYLEPHSTIVLIIILIFNIILSLIIYLSRAFKF